jgi:hypothetical protein
MFLVIGEAYVAILQYNLIKWLYIETKKDTEMKETKKEEIEFKKN